MLREITTEFHGNCDTQCETQLFTALVNSDYIQHTDIQKPNKVNCFQKQFSITLFISLKCKSVMYIH